MHGCNGLMRVENPRYENPLHDRFFEAAAQAGIPANDNFNNWGHSQAGPSLLHGCLSAILVCCLAISLVSLRRV